MTFEYKVFTIPEENQRDDNIAAKLNEFGNEGWEVVASFIKANSLSALILKRPKQ